MQGKAQDDDALMSLVELALARPAEERTVYLRSACAGDLDLYREACNYVDWETRMQGFLLSPFYSPGAMEHPFEPGEMLANRFRIVREVAQGGMGVVYEAVDQKLGRTIALKCAKAGFGNRLPPEVRHATEISHPNVCKIFEIHTAATRLGEIEFVTMEFLAGETLADRLAHGPMPGSEAAAIAQQLCAGLAEAHRNRVIHGDLKSNNVILTVGADGGIRAVITDFGLARGPEAERAGHAGASGGTPDYMAPELLQGGKPSVASDLYALGVMLHEMAYGKRPKATGMAIANQPKWDRVIARCLDVDAKLRFHDAGEVAEALAPSRRFRWWLAGAVAAALAAVSVLITYQSATAPSRQVHLAMLPFEGDAAGNVSRAVEAELKQLKGGKSARLSIVPALDRGVTQMVRGSISQENGKVVVRIKLMDQHTGTGIDEREFTYAPGDVRYLTTAVAGMVTYALALPPPPVSPVNAAAKQDYQEGLEYTRRNSTVDKALPLLERAAAEDRDSPLTWAALAEGQWFKYVVTSDKRWLNRTAQSVQQAQDRNLDVAAVHRIAGLLLPSEQSQTEYLRAINLDKTNADGYRRLGQAYDKAGKWDEGLAALKRAVELDPGYFKPYQNLGEHYWLRGNTQEAALQLEKCVQLAPNEADPHFALGTVYHDLSRFQDAERELRKAIALDETAKALGNLAFTLRFQSRDREAITFLLRARELAPDDYVTWMNLGDCYRRTRQDNESVRAYRRGLELVEREIADNPSDTLVRSRLSYLCARLKQQKRAESEIAQALKMGSPSSNTLEAAVWTYEALSSRDKAIAVLESAPREEIAQVVVDVARWPDLAELSQDSRFRRLLEIAQSKK